MGYSNDLRVRVIRVVEGGLRPPQPHAPRRRRGIREPTSMKGRRRKPSLFVALRGPEPAPLAVIASTVSSERPGVA
jgi:hypothetical protein